MEVILSNIATIKDPRNDILSFCKRNLTIDNPAFYSNERMGFSNFATKRSLYYYNWDQDNKTLVVPIGFWIKHFHYVPFKDERTRVHSDEIANLTFSATLTPKQVETSEKIRKFTNGVICCPTGFGKTVTALEIIKQMELKTLFLVHTVDLAKQFKDRCKTFLGYEAGLIGSGKFEVKDISVGILQTLMKLDEEKMDIINQNYSLVFIDECHITPADAFFNSISKLNATYKYGMSATPERQDGKTDLIFWGSGPLRHEIKLEEVKENLCIPSFEYIPTDFQFPIFSSREYSKMLETMAGDDNRNRIIVDARNKYPDKSVVVLCKGQLHMEHLASLIDGARFLHSKVKKKEREQILADFAEGKFRTLVSSYKLLGTGIDNNLIDVVVMAAPTNQKNDVKQTIGRTMRKREEKEAIVVDIVDSKVSMLSTMARNRRRWYKEYIELAKKEGKLL